MKTLQILCSAIPFAALLAACSGPRPNPDEQVEPARYIALASQSPCANGGNRLFSIDQRFVFWDRGASCQDQVLRLYGTDASRPLCVFVDSARGPHTSCTDPSARAMFDTILQNRQAADLGLGAFHAVAPIAFVPEAIVNLVFQTVAQESFSAIRTARTVVVRNAVQWAALWAEHTAGRDPAPPPPQVDFTTHMLAGIFAGDLRGCHEFAIRRVNVEGLRIDVEYEDRDLTPYTLCVAAITNPMHVVALPHIDAEVAFSQVTPGRIAFNTIDRSTYSGVEEPINVVVRDMQTWSALWRRHTGSGGPAPAIDFSTTVVAGVFRGILPNGCYSTEIVDVYHAGSGLNVHRVDSVPREGAVCTLAIVTPAHLIAVPRSDESVVFSAERKSVP